MFDLAYESTNQSGEFGELATKELWNQFSVDPNFILLLL